MLNDSILPHNRLHPHRPSKLQDWLLQKWLRYNLRNAQDGLERANLSPTEPHWRAHRQELIDRLQAHSWHADPFDVTEPFEFWLVIALIPTVWVFCFLVWLTWPMLFTVP